VQTRGPTGSASWSPCGICLTTIINCHPLGVGDRVRFDRHRDRLARFGSEYIEAALAACGRKLIVVDYADLVQDMVDVLTSSCSEEAGDKGTRRRAG
jgi:hypothetical protein